ncbi:MAG: hypothetical protein JW870_05930 [Candidatus Delongbacteria bacterium]|nr:hypothetical protein [Candidatus Delongbacteria bacterium]
MSDSSIMVPKDEYDMLRTKADLFDHYVETEELSKEELSKVKKALKGPLLTKLEFLKRHPELA